MLQEWPHMNFRKIFNTLQHSTSQFMGTGSTGAKVYIFTHLCCAQQCTDFNKNQWHVLILLHVLVAVFWHKKISMTQINFSNLWHTNFVTCSQTSHLWRWSKVHTVVDCTIMHTILDGWSVWDLREAYDRPFWKGKIRKFFAIFSPAYDGGSNVRYQYSKVRPEGRDIQEFQSKETSSICRTYWVLEQSHNEHATSLCERWFRSIILGKSVLAAE